MSEPIREISIDAQFKQLRAQIDELHCVVTELSGRVDFHAAGTARLAGRLALLETRIAVTQATCLGKIDGLREEIAGLTRWLL